MLELKDIENNMLWICKAFLAMEAFFLCPLKVEENARVQRIVFKNTIWNKIMTGAKGLAFKGTYHAHLINTQNSMCEFWPIFLRGSAFFDLYEIGSIH